MVEDFFLGMQITIVSLDLQAMNWNLLLCLIQSLSLNLLNKI